MEVILTEEQKRELRNKLAKTFEELLKTYEDTPEVRLFIVNYAVGYMGAVYGLHIPR